MTDDATTGTVEMTGGVTATDMTGTTIGADAGMIGTPALEDGTVTGTATIRGGMIDAATTEIAATTNTPAETAIAERRGDVTIGEMIGIGRVRLAGMTAGETDIEVS